MEFLFFGVVWAAVVGVRIYASWSRRQGDFDAARAIDAIVKRGRRLDETPIREVGEACVMRVVGEVQRLDTWAVSPLTKKPCARWQLKVSVLEYSAAAGSTYWRTMFVRDGGVPFVLASSDGRCCVEPSLSTVDVTRAQTPRVESARRVSAGIAEILEGEGISPSSLAGTKVKVEEAIIAFGTRIAVVGAGRVVPRPLATAPDAGYRDEPPSWLCLSGTDDELLISDRRSLLVARGTGGGTRSEPLRGPAPRDDVEPGASSTMGAMNVDEYESALTTRARRRRRAFLIVAALVTGTALVVRVVRNTGDPCALDPLARDFAAHGAAATQDAFTQYGARCPTTTVQYLRLHLDFERSLGDTNRAADDADTLLASIPDTPEPWYALAADRRPDPLGLLRQGFALASTDVQRLDANATAKRLSAEPDCDDQLLRRALGVSTDAEAVCLGLSRGTASFVRGVRVPARVDSVALTATIDPRVGRTLVSIDAAKRLGLPDGLGAMAVLQGKLVHGELAHTDSVAVGTTSTAKLDVLVTADLPPGDDLVIGLDYILRFRHAYPSNLIVLGEW